MSKKVCQICERKTDQRYGTTVGKWACAKCVKKLEQSNSIPRSSLPALLPDSLGIGPYDESDFIELNIIQRTFLAALLNAVYPAKSP